MIKSKVKYSACCDGCGKHAWDYDHDVWQDTQVEATTFALQAGAFPLFEFSDGRMLCKKCAEPERLKLVKEALEGR